MEHKEKKLITVVGATGQQGGAVVLALQARNQFKVRALTRNPAEHRELADEVIQADLNRPETLAAAFAGAHGVFLVTKFGEKGTDEVEQATTAVRAAKDAGVKHFVWSTLPDVEAISRGTFHVPHFTGKAKVDRIVKEAGLANHTFVIAPFYYQNLIGVLAPQNRLTKPWAGLSMFDYFQTHTYLGPDSRDQIALANKIAGGQPTKFSAWAQVNFSAAKDARSAAR
jgi:uncharacterized protein YbjT (DUF2867 family)